MNAHDGIPAFLYQTSDGGTRYYGTVRQVTSGMNVNLLGVAVREPQARLSGASGLKAFIDGVDADALAVEWFDTLAAADNLIAELLIRDDAGCSAVRTVTRARDCDIVGAAVRSEGETIGFREERANFERVVDGAAVASVWFDE